MVLSRDEDGSRPEPALAPTSLEDVGRSLRHARELAGLSPAEAAAAASVPMEDLVALESGSLSQLSDRVGTLRALRDYADSLGLAGDDYIVAAVNLWPVPPTPPMPRHDSGSLPVVSVSAAPAGGHSPRDGGEWAGDATGVADSTISGMVGSVLPLSINDTGQTSAVETGETPVVRQTAPALLKVLVVVVALLVVLGGVALAERSHVPTWYHDATRNSAHWYHEAVADVGIAPKPKAPASAHAGSIPSLPRVTYVENPSTNAVTINVAAKSFSVKMAAFAHPCWIQVTDVNQPTPIFSQVLPGGETHVFTVKPSITVETASSSGRAYIYDGTKFIGYYFPSQVPFTMTFNATG